MTEPNEKEAKQAAKAENQAVTTTPVNPAAPNPNLPQILEVELPAGGQLHVQTVAELDMWNRSLANYKDDYSLVKQNDLVGVGNLLVQQLTMFRAQQMLAGMAPEFDKSGLPTGRYKAIQLGPKDLSAARKIVEDAAEEIRKQEKALGVDKNTREAGGQATVANYIATLKKSANRYGIHITKRLKLYDQIMNEARWKLRLLKNGDAEDKKYHNLTPQSICDWLEVELTKAEEHDKKYAREVGRLFIGKV